MTGVGLVRIDPGEESDLPSVQPARRSRLSAEALRWLHDSVPKQTYYAYKREWDKFVRWCEYHEVSPVPVLTDHLTNWVADRCTKGNSQTVIEQGISAVVFFHENYYNVAKRHMPDRRDAWRILAGYRRMLIESGWRPDEAATYTIEQLRAMSATLPDGTALGIRDRAGLLLATGAFARRSQLVGLDIGDVHFTHGKVVMTIVKSKEDQRARGRRLVIEPGAHPLSDAVGALRAWVNVLASKGIRSGPLFRQMRKTSFGYKILDYRLEGEWLGRVVKHAVRDVGITAPSGRTYRAHSTRASGATMAFRAGRPSMQVAEHGGWSVKGTQVHRYNRPEEQESVTEGLM
jgi:integrase